MQSFLLLASILAFFSFLASCLAPSRQGSQLDSLQLATLYVALGPSDGADSPISLQISAPASAVGVIICPGHVLDACRQGLGELRTTDHQQNFANGMRVFKTNLNVTPRQDLQLSLVAHDAQGNVLGANVVRMERR